MTRASQSMRMIASTFALLLLVAGAASAQEETGALYGTVIDSQGTLLPGVTVTLRGIGADKLQISDELAKFRFLKLDPGLYGLKAQLDGFAPLEYPDIDIRAGRSTTLELQLTAAVQEVISVTAESPLLDERKVSQGAILTQLDLEKIPTARDPWSVVNQAPGVMVDRINVGGNESGQQSVMTAPGVAASENDYLIDGIQVTDMTYAGGTVMYYDFDQFAQVELATGGSDIAKATAGVSINMVTRRGTDEPRGSGRFLLTDADGYFGVLEQSEPRIDPDDLAPGQDEDIVGNQVDRIEEVGFEAGGPAWPDHLWLWGSWNRNDIGIIAADGQDDDTLLENTALKLNARISAANSFLASWNDSDKEKRGRGAGPDREPDATWDQDGSTALTKLEDTHVFGANLVLTGTGWKLDLSGDITGRGGVGPEAPEALLDSDGVSKRNEVSLLWTASQEGAKLEGAYFFGAGASSHELELGGRWRQYDDSPWWIYPGRQLYHMAGETWGLPPGPVDFLMAHRSEMPVVSYEYTSLWAQDTLTLGSWTVNAGLRYDLQRGENRASRVPANPVFPELLPAVDFPGNDAGGFDWETISPRIGVTHALGDERRTLLRASFARFAEALGSSEILRLNPLSGAYAYFYFIDGNDNNVWDNAEVDGDPVFLLAWGFDPENPAALETPDVNDPGLGPDITDELVVGVEHSLLPELVVGLNLSGRRISRVKEDRLFLRQPDGTVRLATRDDYFLEKTLAATLPDGRTGTADFYALHPGLSYSGGSYRTNGDRRRDHLAATFTLTKRLSRQWMMRGFFNYSRTTWDIPDSFFSFDDPTDDWSTSDNDGELFMVTSSGARFGEVFLQSYWSFNLNGMYQVAPRRAWGFNVAGNLYGREGYPLPYRVSSLSDTDGNARFAALGRSDDFRTQDIYTLDLRLEKEFAASEDVGLTFSIDAFNVFNENYVLRRSLRLNGPRPDYLNETLSPRIYRLGVRLNWR